MQKPQVIIKEAKMLMQSRGDDVSVSKKKKEDRNDSLNKKKKEHKRPNIAVNNRCGIAVQKELMTLADDFCVLDREDVKKIIETCRNYDEGQHAIMEVYKEVYLQ